MTIGYKRLCGYHNHPNADKRGVILEHRFVMSQKLNRPLSDTEVVHHINNNSMDNRPENLMIDDNASHATKHAKERAEQYEVECTCAYCGNKFIRTKGYITAKQKHAQQTDFYCNKSCMAKGFTGKKHITIIKHGTQQGYRNGCKCDKCKKSNTNTARKYRMQQRIKNATIV